MDSERLSRQQRRARARARRKAAPRGSAADKVLASGAALALGMLGLGAPADAATFSVTNLNDAGPGSLRQAVSDANGSAGADVITFQAGLTGTITLTSGQLSVYNAVDIQGPGAAALTVDGNNASRVFYLYADSSGVDVTLSGLTIAHGSDTNGGGILDNGENLTLDHVVIQNNAATGKGGRGGGVDVEGSSGSLTLLDSTISGNTATGKGGGIYLYESANPSAIRRSTISGNTAGGNGGGAYFYDLGAPLVIENSTISGNQATGNGGGLDFYSANAGVTIQNSTIAGNTATYGGGVYLYQSAVTVLNSIIAGNTATGETNAPDLGGGGTFDLSYTLVQTPGSANIVDNGGNLFNQDPLLGPLGNHGGPTQTRLPAGNSPVINAGDPAFTPPPATDQRGFPRVVNGRLDMGAVELAPGTLQLAVSAATVGEAAGTVTITVTRTGGADGAVSATYATSDGTAVAPGDYAAASGTVSFADQDAVAKTFQVTIVDDNIPEPDETFTANLSAPTGGAVLGAIVTETVTIQDNDQQLGPPAIPTLGDAGKALLAGLLAAGGLLLVRRRRNLAAPVVALTLTLGGVQAADAKVIKPPKEVKAGTLLQTQLAGATATLHLADGTAMTVPLGAVEIRDHRHHHHARTAALPGLAALPAGQPVVIKIRHAADGSVQRVKVQLFDTAQAAQASVAGH